MARLSAADIIRNAGQVERKTVDVEVPWGPGGSMITVNLRQFLGSDTDAISNLNEQKGANGRPAPKTQLRGYILQRGIVDETGQLVFNHSQEHIKFLCGQPVAVTNPLMRALAELNGGENLEEELAENFESDPADDSLTS